MVVKWVVLVVRLPAGPSRHRVATWRELRRLGAISLGSGAWAAPATRAFLPGLGRVAETVNDAGGELLDLEATPRGDSTATRLEAAFNEARQAEWVEFCSECNRFVDEIAKEQRIGKLTPAELDEEEHSLDRLRHWWRDLKARDAFELPIASEAETKLKSCVEVLEHYADQVYAAVHHPIGDLSETDDG
jgi:Protein ChrB, N-terminal